MGKKSIIARILLVPPMAFALLVGLAYARVELLTQLHEREFDAIVAQHIRPGTVSYIRVFGYGEKRAKVLVVAKYSAEEFLNGGPYQYKVSLFLYLAIREGVWRIADDEAVWSGMGSADSMTFPPYW